MSTPDPARHWARAAALAATAGRVLAVLLLSFGWTVAAVATADKAEAAAGGAPRLGLPIDCTPGLDCFIQNYMDVDPGPDGHDYSCGPLANDGHKGTDFRVPDLAAVARGVAVLAAAPGKVAQVRDGAPDGFPDEVAPEGTAGRECGNGVLIDHGGGWSSQYCHLRQGSLRVAPGQAVAAGEAIGLVGMSGAAEFPHVHLSLWHQGRAVDPFLGEDTPGAASDCRSQARPLWRPDAARQLAYRPSGVLNAGFTSRQPTPRGVERGDYLNQLPRRSGDLWFYVRMFGLRAGDRQRLRVFGPGDRLVLEHTTEPAEADQTLWMLPVGRQAPAEGWPPGTYRGEFILIRRGAVVLDAVEEVEIP